MSVITNSYGNVVSSFFGAKFGKHIEELLVSPLAELDHRRRLLGRSGLVRGLSRRRRGDGIVSLAFTHLHVHHIFITTSTAVLLTSLTFSLGGFLNALFAKNFDQVNFIPGPKFVLSAAHVSPAVCFIRSACCRRWALVKLSYANPILYMVNAFRYGFLGTSDVNVGEWPSCAS